MYKLFSNNSSTFYKWWLVYHILSRQMVIFCVERRKAWRILLSRVGIINNDYIAQKEILAQIDNGEMSVEDFLYNRRENA